jgi:hypothetical protein
MAILAIVEIPADRGGAAADAQQWAARNERELPAAPGFVVHADGPTETGWRLVQVWESEEDLQRFFDEHVKPYLPPNAPSPADAQRIYQLAHVVTGAPQRA